MRKKVIFGAVAALFLGAGIFTSVNLTQKPKMSNLTLANIEAMTISKDDPDGVKIDCNEGDATCPIKVILADGSRGTIDAKGLKPVK